MITRHDIESLIADTIKAETGAVVEVTISESKARGPFVSLAGTKTDLARARRVMDLLGTWTDRDEDPEEPTLVIDFYSTSN